jgi:hypothetical protein
VGRRLQGAPSQDKKNGSSCLYIACYHGHLEAVKVLIKADEKALHLKITEENPLASASVIFKAGREFLLLWQRVWLDKDGASLTHLPSTSRVMLDTASLWRL